MSKLVKVVAKKQVAFGGKLYKSGQSFEVSEADFVRYQGDFELYSVATAGFKKVKNASLKSENAKAVRPKRGKKK